MHKDFKIADELITESAVLCGWRTLERSPMYHVEMMAAVEDIRYSQRLKRQQIKMVSSQCSSPCRFVLKLARMQLLSKQPTRRKVAMFGDSAAVAGSLNYEPKLVELLKSRLFGYRKKPIYFVLSVSAPPSFQPGHSHCDALSFELSFKTKIITDTGCGSYQNFEVREHCRKSLSPYSANRTPRPVGNVYCLKGRRPSDGEKL